MTDFTPTTKRLIVGSIGLFGAIISTGWLFGMIEAKDAMIPLSMIIGGFLSLLKGVE